MEINRWKCKQQKTKTSKTHKQQSNKNKTQQQIKHKMHVAQKDSFLRILIVDSSYCDGRTRETISDSLCHIIQTTKKLQSIYSVPGSLSLVVFRQGKRELSVRAASSQFLQSFRSFFLHKRSILDPWWSKNIFMWFMW